MAEKHIKKCSTSLVIREIKIKTSLRFHLTPVIIAKINNTSDYQGCRAKETLLIARWSANLHSHFGYHCDISPGGLEQSTSRPSNATLGYIPKGCSILPQEHLNIHVNCGFIHNNQKLETNLDALQLMNG